MFQRDETVLQTQDGARAPSFKEIEHATCNLVGRVVQTPVITLVSDRIRPYLPENADISVKLELFQHAGSFKARGALLNIDGLDSDARVRGITTVSAGNHALALCWAAVHESVHVKVVMPKSADPVRVAGCRALGAEIVLVEDIHAAFQEMDRIIAVEGRTSIHPFEGPLTVLGTATCGLEFARQVGELDALVVPIGGGGLIAGMSRATKLLFPKCMVIGVEPYGADSMYQSIQAGKPVAIPRVKTIADSLGSPTALPYTFKLAHDHVDEFVRIHDEEMLVAMALLYDALKIAAEPAGAAATAAIIGPLCQKLTGKRVGAIVCGSNIGERAFAEFAEEGRMLIRAR